MSRNQFICLKPLKLTNWNLDNYDVYLLSILPIDETFNYKLFVIIMTFLNVLHDDNDI